MMGLVKEIAGIIEKWDNGLINDQTLGSDLVNLLVENDGRSCVKSAIEEMRECEA